jgi:hypothetical protein
MVRSGSTLIQLNVHAVADYSCTGTCFIYGTATRGT